MTNFLKWLGSTIGPQSIISRLFGSNGFGGVKSWFTNNEDGNTRFSLKGFQDWLDAPFEQINGLVDSFVNATFSSGRTQQQIEQDEYTAMREDSSFQRKVADMQASGLNPALMYQSGATSPSVNSAASPSQPSFGISDILQLAMLPLEMQKAEADIRYVDTQSEKVVKESQGIELDNQFKADTLEMRTEAELLANTISRKRANEIDATITKIVAETHESAERADTEESKRELNFAAALLDKVNAHVAIELLPYSQALAEAKTQADKNYACLMAVQTLYQRKLITDGYLDAIIGEMKASASTAESRAAVERINSEIRQGKFGNDGSFLGNLGAKTLGAVVLTLDQLKGLASVGLHFGKNLGKNKKQEVNPGYTHDPFGYLAGE